MGDRIISGIVTVLTAIVAIAILAVLVSSRAKTSEVIKSAGNAFSSAITAAVNPYSGGGGFTGGGVADFGGI